MTIIRTKAQEAAYRIALETLKRVRADVLVQRACWRDGAKLSISGEEIDLRQVQRVIVLGAGKASAAMAQALSGMLEGVPLEGLVVTKYGHSIPAGRIRVMEAAHPVPDENSLIAGRRLLHLASTASEGDLVIVLISGGASSLMESPAEGVKLRQIQDVTQFLLRAGADIEELNTVRSSLSKIKAGGLARACGNARIVCLVLSDIEGNPRHLIGSGPCWSDATSPEGTLKSLLGRGYPVSDDLKKAVAGSRATTAVHPPHVVIGDVFTLLEEAQRAAAALGFRARVCSRAFSGEAREVAATMAAEALSLEREIDTYDCFIAAGESVVTVRGQGLGGRNQELACAAALALAGARDVALISLGTDGTDGPTDAAGGLVDGETHRKTDLRAALDKNDSYRALEAADGLVITGPTQTNLNDLVVAARVSE